MAKPNYSFEKRQRELAKKKKKKQEEKDAKKREARAAATAGNATDDAPEAGEAETPAATEAPAGPKIHRGTTAD